MGSMVERVARAICAAETGGPLGYFPDGSPMRDGGVGEEYSVGQHKEWREAARAAIEAMMEPTPAMIEAYEGMVCEFRMSEALSAKIAWQAMLSAALSDTEGR